MSFEPHSVWPHSVWPHSYKQLSVEPHSVWPLSASRIPFTRISLILTKRGGDWDGRVEYMLQFSLGMIRMDKIRNEYIRGTAQVGKFGEKTREARLRWYGHLRRKDDGYIGRRILRMELPRNREGLKGGLWMRWDRTWLRLKWWRRMQKLDRMEMEICCT